MTWQKWTLLGLVALSELVTIAIIGKPRTAITPRQAVVMTVFNAGYSALVVSA